MLLPAKLRLQDEENIYHVQALALQCPLLLLLLPFKLEAEPLLAAQQRLGGNVSDW